MASINGPKIADLAVKFRNHSGTLKVKFVLEVGFSESYEQLAREARLGVDGTLTVSVCVLVDLQENPRYRCPTSHLSDANLERLKLPLATTPEMFQRISTFRQASKDLIGQVSFPRHRLNYGRRIP